MAYFQNVYEFARFCWVLGDRQYVLDFDAPPNVNRSDYQLNWVAGPWDFSSSGVLTINYAWDIDYKNYSALSINVTGSTPSATSPEEVVALLNANVVFAEMFVAKLYNTTGNASVVPTQVIITSKRGRVKQMIRVYISNTGAELQMRFNKKAPVVELPGYMERHTIAERFNFPDSLATLILLDPGDPDDAQIITNAGLDPTDPLADWELLAGRSGIFNFQKNTVDGSNRITQTIFYPAGAKAGDFARLTKYAYTGANTNPSQTTEQPYTLTSGDLITP